MSKKTVIQGSTQSEVISKNNSDRQKNTSLVSFSSQKPVFTQEQIDKFLTIAICAGLIIGVLLLAYKIIPQNIYPSTNFAKAEKKKEEDKKNAEKLAEEKKKFEAQKEQESEFISGKYNIVIKTNLGDIDIKMSPNVPNTTDNFQRLIYRKMFENNKFQRIVKDEELGFYVIQGGDKGVGASAALTPTLNDEVWKVPPEYDAEGRLVNTPEFKDPSLYRDFKVLGLYKGVPTSEVVYPKGTIAMAKTSAPNSATTQFFITLKDAKLQPDYTAFGVVENPEILDKILSEVKVKPVEGMPITTDGEPAEEFKINDIQFR